MKIKGADGRFKRIRKIWDGSDWDDGYVCDGRFRVYRPDYPRAYAEGYAQRAHVVWWLAKGRCHPRGTDLHHKNEIKLDDRLSNLKVKSHERHAIDHHPLLPLVVRVCHSCGREFKIKRWKKSKFCSQSCYHSKPRSKEHRKHISRAITLVHAQRKGAIL